MNDNTWLYADPLAKDLSDFADHDIYEMAERAAILEYDAKLSRPMAELQAIELHGLARA